MQKAYHFQLRTKFFGELLSFFVLFACSNTNEDNAEVIDLSRFLSRYRSSENNIADKSAINQNIFFGVPGSDRLMVTTSSDAAGVNVQLNGPDLAGAGDYSAAGKFEVPVTPGNKYI